MRLADGPFAVDAFDSRDGFLAATPRQILSALGKRSHARVADVRAKFEERGIVTGVTYSRAVVPIDARLYAFLLAQAREELRRLHPNASLDEQRALVVGVYTDVLEAARFDDLASAAARAASSNAADFEALRAHDADLLSRARSFPQKLAEIVRCHADVVSWDATAGKLVIVDRARFASEVMSRYFRTSEFESFQRQLTSFGFSKVWEVDASLPAGVTVYSNTAVADLAKLVRGKAAAPASAPLTRAARAAQRVEPAPATLEPTATETTLVKFTARGALPVDPTCPACCGAPEAHKCARGGGRVAEFPKKLDKLVRQHADVVSWNATTHELVIDQARLEREVLPLYFKMRDFDSFRSQLGAYGFSKVNQSAADAPRPAGVKVYSNTAVTDLTKLVKCKSGKAAAPAPAPQDLTATASHSFAPGQRVVTTNQAGPPLQGELITCGPEMCKVKFDAWSDELDFPRGQLAPAPDAPALQSQAPQVQLDDEDDAAPWSGPAPELGGEDAPPQDAPVAARAAAAAVAAVAAPPVLAPTAAAGASPKRSRASSPVGVTARVQFTHLRETRDVDLAGGGSRRRSAAEARAVRGGRAAIVRPGRRAGARCLGRRLLGSAHGVRRA